MGLQNHNPFGKNFAPFEMPDDAPLRGLIGQKTPAQRNAAPQNANPFASNFQPFYIPNDAPIRGVIGQRPNQPIPPRIERKPGPFDEGYVKPNTSMDPIDESAADPDRRTPPARSVLTPQTVRKNANDVVQKGTDMSRGFNELLESTGQTPFSSTQLFGTVTNPFTRTPAKTDGFPTEQPDIGGYNGATYDSETGRQAAGSRDISEFAPITGNEGRIPGGSQGINYEDTGISSGRLSDALNGVKEQEANREMTPDRRQQMARAAFLNADNSMDGLKARDAVNEVVYAGGQHWGRGALTEDSGFGDKFKIDRADARGIASGKNTAAGLLDTYKTRITETQKATPAESQSPLSDAGSAVKSAFSAGARTDRKLQGKSTARDGVLGGITAGAQTDFNLNNSN